MNLLAAAVCEVGCGQGSCRTMNGIIHQFQLCLYELFHCQYFACVNRRIFWDSWNKKKKNVMKSLSTHLPSWPIAKIIDSSNSQQQTYSYLSFFFILNAMNQKASREKKNSLETTFHWDSINQSGRFESIWSTCIHCERTTNTKIRSRSIELRDGMKKNMKKKPKVRTILSLQTEKRHNNIENRICTKCTPRIYTRAILWKLSRNYSYDHFCLTTRIRV